MTCRMFGITGKMKNKIIERTNLWDYLKDTEKPIVLYGMGDGAQKIINVCENYNIKISGIFASDEFARGNDFCGFKVEKLSDIEKKYDEFIILLCFGAGYSSLIEKIRSLDSKYELYAPDVPLFGGGLFTYEHFLEIYDKAESVYNMLSDSKSKEVLCDIINFKISGKIKYLFSSETERDEAVKLIAPKSDDIYVDAGAYNGDTVAEMLSYTDGKMRLIYALEPDKRNFRKLSQNTENYDFVSAVNAGAWSEDTVLTFSQKSGRNSAVSKEGKPTGMVAIDNLTSDATIIKYDVEGAEYEAIIGSKKNIVKNKPRLLVSLYHRTDDIFDLPLLVQEINPEYAIFMRHHPYIPAWETNLYAK